LRCSACRRIFNERSGTPFTSLEYPSDLVLLVVFWRLREKVSLRDLAERFMQRGFVFTQETVREWEAWFSPLLADQLRMKRRGQAGKSWPIDETDVSVQGTWCSRYRAIDRDGTLVDSMLSTKRDMEAAQRFFTHAVEVGGHPPERVTTDGYDSSPMRGCGNIESASRFWRAFEELRQCFWFRSSMKQQVSLAHQREVFRQRWDALKTMVPLAQHRRIQRKESAGVPCDLSSDTSPCLTP
jgi:transposase-like protein